MTSTADDKTSLAWQLATGANRMRALAEAMEATGFSERIMAVTLHDYIGRMSYARGCDAPPVSPTRTAVVAELRACAAELSELALRSPTAFMARPAARYLLDTARDIERRMEREAQAA